LLPDTASGAAVDMLRNWDAVLSPDSAAAALFNVWLHRHLKPALARRLLPDKPELVSPLGDFGVLRMMAEPGGAEIVTSTLGDAYRELQTLASDDPASWKWGALHRTNFRHPLQHLATGELAELMRYPSYPLGGSENTTNNTGFDPDDMLLESGASFRMVLDVGNWDAATMTNVPGQSGDPRSPFYGNLLAGWAEKGSFPLLYSREEIVKHRALTISLRPR
jgi:penicillin amidase